ncbi:MAG: DUF2007 domain-containing protein [Candidatus Omnitrophota bacterium]
MNEGLIPVFSSYNRADIMTAKSLLTSAGIEYYVEGEDVQDIIAWGSIGGGNPVTGPVNILVDENDAPEAVEILKEITTSRPSLPDGRTKNDSDSDFSAFITISSIAGSVLLVSVEYRLLEYNGDISQIGLFLFIVNLAVSVPLSVLIGKFLFNKGRSKKASKLVSETVFTQVDIDRDEKQAERKFKGLVTGLIAVVLLVILSIVYFGTAVFRAAK